MSSELRTRSSGLITGRYELLRITIWKSIIICNLAFAVFSTNATCMPTGLTVTIAGTGTGSVNSNPSGISCETGSIVGCSGSFNSGETITLYATPGSNSTFFGWGGCEPLIDDNSKCSKLLGDLIPNTATAFFLIKQLVKVGPDYFSTIQDAFDSATDGAIIEGIVNTFIEDIVINRDIIVTFKGGKSDDFNNIIGSTMIQGSLTISNGTLVATDLVIS